MPRERSCVRSETERPTTVPDLVVLPEQRSYTHVVVTGTERCLGRPEQMHWLQACLCGWERSGKYLRSHEDGAQGHLRQLAAEHSGN